MKDDGTSFLFYIFQDPLLTIIALILLNTSWIVIPERIEPEAFKSSTDIRNEDSLKKNVMSIESKLNRLKMEFKSKQEELEWLKKKIGELNAMLQGGGEDIDQISQKIQELQTEIEKKKEELKQLEDVLKKAREELSGLPQVENAGDLYSKVSELERDIEEKRNELSHLENQIAIARQDEVKIREQADAQKRLIAQLQNELKAKLGETEKLKVEISKIGSGGGYRPFIKSDKNAFLIELENNRLYPVNLDNIDDLKKYYDCTYYKSEKTLVLKRKASIKGEDISEIEISDSSFSKILNKAIKEERPITFFLSGDSFKIFRRAREIVQDKGIGVGWWTHSDEKGVVIIGIGTDSGTTVPIQLPQTN